MTGGSTGTFPTVVEFSVRDNEQTNALSPKLELRLVCLPQEVVARTMNFK